MPGEIQPNPDMSVKLDTGVTEVAKLLAEDNGQTLGEYVTELVLNDLQNHDLTILRNISERRRIAAKILLEKTIDQKH